MRTRNIQKSGCRLPGIFCLALVLASCTSEIAEEGWPDGTPATVRAEIETATPVLRAVDDVANAYDRSTFLTNDQISITKTYKTTSKTVYYKYDGTTWNVVGNDPVTLQAGATYQAQYPHDYSEIRQNQSTSDSYRASNLLQTKEGITSRNGVLDFTGDNAFKHKHTKVTLGFSGEGATLSGAFSNFTISAPGLRTGGSNAEEVVFYRPADNAYNWCGIVYPQGKATDISLSLTYNGVTYNATISCPMAAGVHYKYALKINNNLLVPSGTEIAGWEDNTIYTGDFDSTN